MVQVGLDLAYFEGCQASHAVQDRRVGGQLQVCAEIALSMNLLPVPHMNCIT